MSALVVGAAVLVLGEGQGGRREHPGDDEWERYSA
jgi:hypothetical protein